jgi:ferrous iron transport protein B
MAMLNLSQPTPTLHQHFGAELNEKIITLALAGQPNVGKTTVFNMLTGLNQHVGNWPGKTVERKEGIFNFDGRDIHLVDLPGTYSLTANSEEERIARDFILKEQPQVVIVIVNAATLERNLYLVAELLSLPTPLVIGLNMTDVAERHGIHVEPHVLEAALGAPVVPLVASKNRGLRELIQAALHLIDDPFSFKPNRPEIRPEHRQVLQKIESLLGNQLPQSYPSDWVALKLLEGDSEITEMVRNILPHVWNEIHKLLMQHEDAYLDIASGRYEWIGRMVRAAVVKPKAGIITQTDRVDRIATHPLWGLLALLGIFGLAFWLTYTAALPLVNWLDARVMTALSNLLREALSTTPTWFSTLIVDGILGGAGTVLTFLPILMVFFIILGFLEDVGYMARAAYVMDRFMHWMGLHGRSFLPLFLGFGCNVPAVMGARIIEDRPARLMTILLAPLVPCTARLAVVAFLAPAFFGNAAALVSWGLIAMNLILLALIGIIAHRIVFKDMHTAFIMEMPLYHLPNPRTIALFVWNNTLAFLRKAGSIILIFSVALWLFATLPGGDIEHSWLADFGRLLEPLGRLVGLTDWRLIVALLSSFVAKENTIAALGILYSKAPESGLAQYVSTELTFASSLAFVVIQMLFIPCVATLATIRQESGGWRWAIASILLQLSLSLVVGILVYQLFTFIALPG